jgi:hypothetical protein
MRKRSEKDLGVLIRDLGGDWKKFEDRRYCPHCKQLIYRVDNRPYDGMATIRGLAIPIEIKSGKKSLRFDQLKDHQREGLREWEKKHGNITWIALQMGVSRPISNPENIPLRFWLFPYKKFINMEGLLEEITEQKSLPYNKDTTRNKRIIEYSLTAYDLLWHWEIIWLDGKWSLPIWHPFRAKYLPDTHIVIDVSEKKKLNLEREMQWLEMNG